MLRNVRIGFSSAPVCVAIVTLIKPGNRAHVERGSSAGTEVGFRGALASIDATGAPARCGARPRLGCAGAGLRLGLRRAGSWLVEADAFHCRHGFDDFLTDYSPERSAYYTSLLKPHTRGLFFDKR